MSQSLSLLDQAFQLGRLEREALNGKNYDLAVELSEQRQLLTQQAWEKLREGDRPAYLERLLRIADLQKELTELARAAHSSILAALQGSRRQKKRLTGYQRTIALSIQ
ncbi:hypothetical protein [uncultured Desulfovibrio sp.]|uniref:hypothetical protein n=1 Tax=uncultured Desulfovibrio sp. TaxID=167968 RepID=UPI00262584A0|nr:hypothetical protein [uncultured Desulfovibrio sp.]